ncbi:MAG TPA: SDR family oxidoreductase [Acidimicrobiales bacterium]|nr:SDR family oxidoreductase [Acidimicrobiales bacterium]
MSPSKEAVSPGEKADPLDFGGKVVVVTGGARGVGRGISEGFLGAGADVVICGRHVPAAEDLPGRNGRTAVFVQADVRDAEQAAEVVAQTTGRFGRLDVLVNNAGGSPSVPAADASARFISQVIALNLVAPFYCAQAANRVMQEQGQGGSIVNIASISGLRPSPGSAAYGAAKAGLINLTRSLAMEWAPKVRVNCVVAGMVATEAADDHYGGPAGVEAVAATVPLRRLGTPDDMAGVCLFLASPLASYLAGAAIEADGGGEWPPFLAAVDSVTRKGQSADGHPACSDSAS